MKILADAHISTAMCEFLVSTGHDCLFDWSVRDKIRDMATQLSLDNRIEITPGVCGGKPRIAGHRIRVQDIAAWYEFHGMSADEIVAGYPQITLADVHAALAYYYSGH